MNFLVPRLGRTAPRDLSPFPLSGCRTPTPGPGSPQPHLRARSGALAPGSAPQPQRRKEEAASARVPAAKASLRTLPHPGPPLGANLRRRPSAQLGKGGSSPARTGTEGWTGLGGYRASRGRKCAAWELLFVASVGLRVGKASLPLPELCKSGGCTSSAWLQPRRRDLHGNKKKKGEGPGRAGAPAPGGRAPPAALCREGVSWAGRGAQRQPLARRRHS